MFIMFAEFIKVGLGMLQLLSKGLEISRFSQCIRNPVYFLFQSMWTLSISQ